MNDTQLCHELAITALLLKTNYLRKLPMEVLEVIAAYAKPLVTLYILERTEDVQKGLIDHENLEVIHLTRYPKPDDIIDELLVYTPETIRASNKVWFIHKLTSFEALKENLEKSYRQFIYDDRQCLETLFQDLLLT